MDNKNGEEKEKNKQRQRMATHEAIKLPGNNPQGHVNPLGYNNKHTNQQLRNRSQVGVPHITHNPIVNQRMNTMKRPPENFRNPKVMTKDQMIRKIMPKVRQMTKPELKRFLAKLNRMNPKIEGMTTNVYAMNHSNTFK
jgi:hypothetical protein